MEKIIKSIVQGSNFKNFTLQYLEEARKMIDLRLLISMISRIPEVVTIKVLWLSFEQFKKIMRMMNWKSYKKVNFTDCYVYMPNSSG